MEVEVRIKVLEVDGEPKTDEAMIIKSHPIWNESTGQVILEMPDGKFYTVSGRELEDAPGRCLDLE